jgi:hypothetical protein
MVLAARVEPYRTLTEIQNALGVLGASPRDSGAVLMIVRRPVAGAREVLQSAELSLIEGLVGDNWLVRGSRHTEDGKAHPSAQITLMNSRVIQAIAQDSAFWPLAGDQFFVDLDLSADNLLPGTRITLGGAVLQVSDYPRNGCGKFTERFGSDATKFINSPEGRAARRRGVNTFIVQPGVVRVGDVVTKH